MDKESRAYVFSQIQYIVDKMHFKGRKGDYCALHCNPHNENYLDISSIEENQDKFEQKMKKTIKSYEEKSK